MDNLQYTCRCIDQYGDITYEAEFNTYSEALNQVDYYRDLIRCNGEEDSHSCIEVVRYRIDEDEEIIDGSEKVLKTYGI